MLQFLAAGAICLVSFITTILLVSRYIKRATYVGITGRDMNKYNRPEVPEGGGVAVLFGFMFAVLLYVFLKTFFFLTTSNLVLIFALLTTFLLAGFMGFIDDVMGWKVGIKRWQKPLIMLVAAVPLVAVNAGESVMNLPLIGIIELGLLYPIVVVPVAIAGASNGFNMLAGYNGLEAGLGIIILSAMGFISWYVNGVAWVAMIAFAAASALFGFLVFNWHPAKIFPGDSLTYSIGALIATVAILGNMEKIGLILFIPFILDAILSLLPEIRGGKVEAYGRVRPDSSLEMPYRKVHDMTHFAIWSLQKFKQKVYERDVVLFLYGVELVFVAVVFAVYVF